MIARRIYMKKHDIIVIGMGPAGMAVSAMGSAMGLDVLAIESHKVGGECLNYGCIPSKALLKASEARSIAINLKKYGIKPGAKPAVGDPLQIVRDKVNQISGPKTMKMFDKVKMVLGKGKARFVDKRTVEVNGKKYTAKKIFIATGTEPFIPPIPGLADVPQLTNMNIFAQKEIPKSLMVIGGGAIGCEMAQAFSRLGSKVTLAQMDPFLLPNGDDEAGRELEAAFEKEGITVYNSTRIEKVEEKRGKIVTHTDRGTFRTDKILVATGRKPVLDPLELENAGIKYGPKGILVNQKMQTNVKHIYAVGDCNGIALLSHAAMHQGMIALMNSMMPLKRFKRKKYIVPWSVFTKPEVAKAGLSEIEAKAKGIKYIVIREKYEDYGRTIADGKPEGFVKVLTNSRGRIFGVTIVGEAASEMIHEWVLAMQKGIGLFDIMMMQHSFPTISLLNKRIAERWMMDKMGSKFIQKMAKMFI